MTEPCLGLLGADREDARKVIGQYQDNLRKLRPRLDAGETDLWLLMARTADGTFHMLVGELHLVMGQILYETSSARIRITLVSLAVAAGRMRFLAERGEIEVDDLPPPGVPQPVARFN